MKRVLTSFVALLWAGTLLAATRTATFSVKGWTCGSCAASTRIALKKVDGVEDVKTDLEKAAVVVTYDDTKVEPDKMVQAIERLGYKADTDPWRECVLKLAHREDQYNRYPISTNCFRHRGFMQCTTF